MNTVATWGDLRESVARRIFEEIVQPDKGWTWEQDGGRYAERCFICADRVIATIAEEERGAP